ncbi:MAG TPA: hypothetical protein VIT91_07225 [Chthoniobacterales bacterium]
MRRAVAILLILLTTSILNASGEIVRSAPEFYWQGINGAGRSLSSLGEQPVILIVAPSPRSRVFRKQLSEIERLYRQYAGRDAIFCAAFTEQPGEIESDVPFLYALDPQQVAEHYGIGDHRFLIAVIGPDRNLDLLSWERTNGNRLRDVIDNGYVAQAVRRSRQ